VSSDRMGDRPIPREPRFRAPDKGASVEALLRWRPPGRVQQADEKKWSMPSVIAAGITRAHPAGCVPTGAPTNKLKRAGDAAESA